MRAPLARQPRFDAPGVVHHVFQRGVERRATFLDDADRIDFLHRLDDILPSEDVRCLAWVLMPNHFHLVLQTGAHPVWKALHRLGTGYSMRFNRRYDRVGHLVQNRFRSRPARDDDDVKHLIRYVHRNPLRAKLVASLDELARNPWTGHGALAGCAPARAFHSTNDALAYFDESAATARAALHAWMLDADRELECESPSFARFLVAREKLCMELGVEIGELEAGSRERNVSRARRALAALGMRELDIPAHELSRALGASPSGIWRAARAVT